MERIVALAEAQHGVVCTRQLRAEGISRHVISGLGRTGDWERVTRDVYRRRGAPRTPVQLALAAVLDCGPTASLSHRSGSALWGHRGSDLGLPVDVTRTTRGSRRSEMARIHIVRELPQRWVTTLHGVPVVRPELVALHMFATSHPMRAERIVDSMWSQRLLSGPSVAALLDDMGRSGRNGTAGLRTYLEQRGPGYVPPASGLEGRMMQVLRSAGLPFRRQVDSGGEVWTGRVDFRHTSVPVVIEVQSELYHGALSSQRDDAARRARLEADGFTVVEVFENDVWTRPDEVVAAVRASLRRFVPRLPR